jgi:hypothetical protein
MADYILSRCLLEDYGLSKETPSFTYSSIKSVLSASESELM